MNGAEDPQQPHAVIRITGTREGTARQQSAPGTVVGHMASLVKKAARMGDVQTVDMIIAELETLCEQERKSALLAEYQARTERARAHADLDLASSERVLAKSLMEQVASHRSEADERRKQRLPLAPAGDVAGADLRPDPTLARTPAEFIEALRKYVTWAGNPSYRDMERACGKRASSSAMCKLLGRDTLPQRFGVIAAILHACGADEEYQQRFATAWRQLAMPRHLRSVPQQHVGAAPA